MKDIPHIVLTTVYQGEQRFQIPISLNKIDATAPVYFYMTRYRFNVHIKEVKRFMRSHGFEYVGKTVFEKYSFRLEFKKVV